MRRVILAASFLLASIGAAAAYDTPKALLEALYFPYFQGADYDWSGFDEPALRSRALNALFDKDAAETPEGDVGRIDFDPYIDAQDYDLTDFAIGEAKVTGDTATVEVTFTNFEQPEDIVFTLVKEPDGWKVDDVESRGAYPYRLTDLLTAPLDD
jgi:hypothetical protein